MHRRMPKTLWLVEGHLGNHPCSDVHLLFPCFLAEYVHCISYIYYDAVGWICKAVVVELYF